MDAPTRQDIEQLQRAARDTEYHAVLSLITAFLALDDTSERMRRALYEHHATNFTSLPPGAVCHVCEKWQMVE